MPIFLKLACEDTGRTEAKMSVTRTIFLVIPTGLILSSYAHIGCAVLKIKSMAGHRKAFGTCASQHLGVSLFLWLGYLYTPPTYSQVF
jgi:olfactory receptor